MPPKTGIVLGSAEEELLVDVMPWMLAPGASAGTWHGEHPELFISIQQIRGETLNRQIRQPKVNTFKGLIGTNACALEVFQHLFLPASNSPMK